MKPARNLSPDVHAALSAIADYLAAPRGLHGEMQVHLALASKLSAIMRRCPQIPHGGLDAVDACSMILQVILDRPVTSAYPSGFAGPAMVCSSNGAAPDLTWALDLDSWVAHGRRGERYDVKPEHERDWSVWLNGVRFDGVFTLLSEARSFAAKRAHGLLADAEG